MGQVIDTAFVSTVNGRGYAALQTLRRNAGNTAYEFAAPAWVGLANTFAATQTVTGDVVASGQVSGSGVRTDEFRVNDVGGGGYQTITASDAEMYFSQFNPGSGNANLNAKQLRLSGALIAASASVSGTVAAGSFTGVGASLTNLNATNLASGTAADARLSSNVPLKNAANVFSANQAINNATAGNVGLAVKSASGQSANVQEWQDAAGAVLAFINPTGTFSAGAIYNINAFAACQLSTDGSSCGIGVSAYSASHQLRVANSTAANIVVGVKGASGQSGNLQEWQQSDGTVCATVSENGYATTRKNAAPADAELAAGECAYWFDATNGAGKFMLKGKTANGTVVTGSVTLA